VTTTINATHAIVISAYEGVNNTSTLSISDSTGGSNTYTQIGGYVSSGSDRYAMFYSCSLSAQFTSITATWSGGLSATIPVVVFDITGLASSGCADGNGTNPATSTQTGTHTTFSSGNLSTTQSTDILIFGMGSGTSLNGSVSAGSGYTLPSNGCTSNQRNCHTYKIVSATQSSVSTSDSYTSTNASQAGIFAAFSTVASGGKPPGQFARIY